MTYYDEMLIEPEPLADVRQAFWAVSGSADSRNCVVLIVAGEEYGREARSWVQTFNAQYMKAGGLPIVRLVICRTPESGAKLSACFDVAETEPEFDERFAAWCAQRHMDRGLWEAR